MQDEVFGPLLPVCRYTDLDVAVRFVRNLPTGKPLACYVFSQTAATLQAVQDRISSGALNLNDCMMHGQPQRPTLYSHN